jgi:serine/threonine-protein kinase RsbW
MEHHGEERLEGTGEVRLVVPAAPEYLRLVRLTAAGLATRVGFTFDEVEDLRIAVDELCFLFVAQPDLRRDIEVLYLAGPDSITIEGHSRLEGALPEPNDLSQQILDALVDEHALSEENGGARFRLVKRRESG